MKKFCSSVLGLSFVLGFAGIAAAQENAATGAPASMPVPKVLAITREFVKPGRTGSTHDRSEAAFVQAMRNAKWPTHYLALDSLSGKSRSLYLTGYESFDAWEKDVRAQQKNTTLSSALEHAATADGALLDNIDQSVWVLREDQSYKPGVNIGEMRYFEFEVFRIKAGHEADWGEAVKMVKEAYAKVPDVHWDMFQLMYGSTPSFVVITPRKSASEIDHAFAQDKQFMEAMGAEGMKKLSELSNASIESSERNLFSINPRASYVTDEVANSAPDFWRPKSAMNSDGKPKAAKAEAKPATP